MAAEITKKENWKYHGRKLEGKRHTRISEFTEGTTLVESFKDGGKDLVILIYPENIEAHKERIAAKWETQLAVVVVKYIFADGEYHVDEEVSTEDLVFEEGTGIVDFLGQGQIFVKQTVADSYMGGYLNGEVDPPFRLTAYPS